MRKSERAKRNAKSTRNRHNGRINADTEMVLARGKDFQTSDGKDYRALINKTIITGGTLSTDEDGVITPEFIIKTRIVRNRAA